MGQACTATSRSGWVSGIGSSGRGSPFGKSLERRASAPRPSARCSTIRFRSRTGREAADIQSSAHIQAQSSGCLGKTLRCRRRSVSRSKPSTSVYPRYGGFSRQLQLREGLCTRDRGRARRGSYLGKCLRPVWENAYDLLTSLEKKRAIDLLFLLSRTDPPVISSRRIEQFFRDTSRVISVAPKPDRREQARQAAFEWMRAVLQKQISPEALRQQIGDIRDIAALLDRLYDGRLSDRNRSMVVLASSRGLHGGT